MKISKKYINNIDYELIFSNDKAEEFRIYFYDNYLYWSMINYDINNEFVISTKDEYLFNYFKCLFEKIKKYDNSSNKLIEGNIFSWKSENNIIVKERSELKIISEEEKFILKFKRGKRDFLSEFHESCDICFNLDNSKYNEIVHLFNMMYICYEEKEETKVKVKTL